MDNSFKLVLSLNNSANQDKDINKIFDGISNNLISYIKRSNYDINVISIENNNTEVEKLANITSLIPNILININIFNENYVANDMYISVYEKDYKDTMQLEFANNLLIQLVSLLNNITPFDVIAYDKSYMNRLRVFPSLTINISQKKINELLLLNDQKAIAKAIVFAITSSFNIPKIGEKKEYITSNNINMKDSPDKFGEYIINIPKNSVIEVIEKTNNNYWKIRYIFNNNIYEGYIARLYITYK